MNASLVATGFHLIHFDILFSLVHRYPSLIFPIVRRLAKKTHVWWHFSSSSVRNYVNMHFWPSALIMADHIIVSPCLRWLAPAPALGWRLHQSAATVNTRQPSCGEDGHKWTTKVNSDNCHLSTCHLKLSGLPDLTHQLISADWDVSSLTLFK